MNASQEPVALAPSELSWSCPDEACVGPPLTSPTFGFGQDRAVAALRFGIGMTAPGYHVFVTGTRGSGRRSTVEEIVRELAKKNGERALRDHAFVHNFDDRSRPRLLSLPKGDARRLQQAMHELLREVRVQIPGVLESDRQQLERERTARSHRDAIKAAFEPFEQKIASDGLVLVSDESSPGPNAQIQALAGGRPVPLAALRADPELFLSFHQAHPIEIADLERRVEQLQEELEVLLRIAQRELRSIGREVEVLEKKAAEELLRELVSETAEAFDDDRVRCFFEQAAVHMVSNLAWFKSEEGNADLETALHIYDVNIVRDASLLDVPVLVEPNPSFANLFGSIDPHGVEGSFEFAAVRAGALLRADGGYLVLQASDFSEAEVWRVLLRTLRTTSLEIRALEGTPFAPTSIQPDAIAIDVKVILVGSEEAYQLLAGTEIDFARVFKVKAEFEDDIANTCENLCRFASVIRTIQTREHLLPLEDSAIARLAEHAARLAGRQARLSLNFGALGDVVRESHRVATVDGMRSIERRSVETSLALWRSRHDRLEREIEDQISEGRLRIETSGTRVGQVNALAVFDREPRSIGLVTRVTAAVGPGRASLVSIERESRLSGPLHDKGVGILRGYLLRRYREAGGLTFAASIAFEQSHVPIDGDSASLAELCALLSALSEVPIAQDAAVTGSVDQCGNVQAIGGVNEKLEAWFRATRANQGAPGSGPFSCIIPRSNRGDLMLGREPLESAVAGRFKVFAVDTVDQAIPILFGVPAPLLHSKATSAIERLRGLNHPQRPE